MSQYTELLQQMLRQLVQYNSRNAVLAPTVTESASGSAVNSVASSVVNTQVNMTIDLS